MLEENFLPPLGALGVGQSRAYPSPWQTQEFPAPSKLGRRRMASHISPATAIHGMALGRLPRQHYFVPGTSLAMQALERVMAQVAMTDIPVLLCGESGTGKEELAFRIHQISGRQTRGLIKLICASLTGEALGELIRETDGGANAENPPTGITVFLDEVTELNPHCQSRLLYSLPEGDAIPTSALLRGRVISSTSQDLEEEVRSGRFRKELYYRLKGVSLRLPPLRERKEDIAALVEIFLTKHSEMLALPKPAVSPRTLHLMHEYNWPGNIRELENVVKKLVAVGDETAALSDLGGVGSSTGGAPDHSEKVSLKEAARAASRQAERELIQLVLTRVRWNRKRAAQELQISYKALLYKLKQMGLDGSNV